MAERWRPTKQPACPCANCNQPPPKAATERKCTEEDPCKFCGPVERFWSLDPSPVAEPPEPGHEKARPLNREPGGVSIQPTAALGFTEFGQRVEPSPGVMRRIFNATRRNT